MQEQQPPLMLPKQSRLLQVRNSFPPSGNVIISIPVEANNVQAPAVVVEPAKADVTSAVATDTTKKEESTAPVVAAAPAANAAPASATPVTT